MSLVNDYFLLYHGMHYESDTALVLNVLDEDFFCEISALLLMCNRKTLPRFNILDSFHSLLTKLCDTFPSTLDELYILQYTLIRYLQEHSSSEYISTLHSSFNYLKEEELLSIENHKKLISLFDPHEFCSFEMEAIEHRDENRGFLEHKSDLQAFIQELLALGDNLSYTDELNAANEYLTKQKFSIGITGVMNAGKSTLLNALIGKELLGSSVIPETANLSLIKYASEPYAKVFYWSKEEWSKILYSGQEFEAIAEFVRQSEEEFKGELSQYIQESPRVDNIVVEELSLYTSAKYKKSNLIKEIELGVDLEFLSEGIELVDTPGLDDIVIQREEITKEYLSKCDLMIHLMNVSQSATQKDIDFIIDALVYQNVGRLLIVLTRADSVKESELSEVINYTKKSIASQLQVQNTESQLDFILASLDFIAVSSKMALFHKTGQGELALKEGYTLEQSGILQLENYLFETLYGDNAQKSELIVNATKKRIQKAISGQIKSLKYELHLLSKNEGELENELLSLTHTKNENQRLISQMRDEVNEYKEDTLLFIKGQENFLDAQMLRVKDRLKSRLMNDFSYAGEKNNKKEFVQGVSLALETAIKDGLIDVLRDYRYKFIQKSESIGEKIQSKYEEYELSMGESGEKPSVLDLVNEYFKGGVVHSSSSMLASRLKKVFTASSSKDLSSLESLLEKELREAFDVLLKSVKQKALSISEKLIEEFFENISIPLDQFEKILENEEQLLLASVNNYEKDEKKRAEYSIQVHKQLKVLTTSLSRCT